jgi:hypothetical protein
VFDLHPLPKIPTCSSILRLVALLMIIFPISKLAACTGHLLQSDAQPEG